MQNENEWDRDPSVMLMRKIFKAMESTQEKILESLEMSPFDPRLRNWRDRARMMFEQTWAEAVSRGINMDGATASAIYARCLAKIFASEGIDVPLRILPVDPRIEALFEEI